MADNKIMEDACARCGGCPLRSMAENEYRRNKADNFARTLAMVRNAAPLFDEPVFIGDGCRRRADMAFVLSGKMLKLGFNQAGTHNLVDVRNCPMLTPGLNAFLPELRRFLLEFCQISVTVKAKRKKMQTVSLRCGSVRMLQEWMSSWICRRSRDWNTDWLQQILLMLCPDCCACHGV